MTTLCMKNISFKLALILIPMLHGLGALADDFEVASPPTMAIGTPVTVLPMNKFCQTLVSQGCKGECGISCNANLYIPGDNCGEWKDNQRAKEYVRAVKAEFDFFMQSFDSQCCRDCKGVDGKYCVSSVSMEPENKDIGDSTCSEHEQGKLLLSIVFERLRKCTLISKE